MHPWRSARRSRTTRSRWRCEHAACQAPGSNAASRSRSPSSRRRSSSTRRELQHGHLRAGSVALKRLTINYGVRLDLLNASVDAQSIAAGPFTPARNFDGVENVPNWKDVDPRLGVAYDLFGERQDGHQGQHRPLCRGGRLHDRASRQPGAVHGQQHDQDVGRSGRRHLQRHLQPVRRLRPDQSRRQQQAPGQVACGAISSPLFGTGADPHDQLRSRARRRLACAAEQLGGAVQHPARDRAARLGVCGLHAPLVRQPAGDPQSDRDQRRLHHLQHSGSWRFASAEWRRRHAVRPLRHQPRRRAEQPDLQPTRSAGSSRTSTTASTSTPTRGWAAAC